MVCQCDTLIETREILACDAKSHVQRVDKLYNFKKISEASMGLTTDFLIGKC